MALRRDCKGMTCQHEVPVDEVHIKHALQEDVNVIQGVMALPAPLGSALYARLLYWATTGEALPTGKLTLHVTTRSHRQSRTCRPEFSRGA